MALLQKSKCDVVMANILFQVFRENCNDYPQSFDDFGKQVTEKLYKQFQFLEGNAITFNKQEKKKESVFEKYAECVSRAEQEVLEMIEPITLQNDEAKTTDQEIIEDIEAGLIKELV